ncbi:MAG: DNA-3-methyladenine glycosylase I [Candidatus Woesearchaeota archaeon]|jgi:DNA-3-methyladenine glycosylase I|nr:DNA-3-methyladenine glycosylase I [Candidatus Woesearchaeota archaeon]
MKRCDWCKGNELYEKYHDEEWGVPVHDDNVLFEFLILEGAQAGLSWITILKKRENYRKEFDNFDYKKIANYNENKVDELMQNEGIIRNKLKINSAIKNAKAFIKIQEEFGSFNNYIWRFTNNKIIKNSWESIVQIPATTPLSNQISKDLKKRGFNFLGSTIIYAYLQAIGIVNDHVTTCFKYNTPY